MKVEVLYVADCPTHPAAVRLVKRVLAAERVEVEVDEVLVRDEQMANELEFLGSPTIRINGKDVAGESPTAKNFGLSCRLYQGSKQIGLPPAEVIHRAVLEARGEGQQWDRDRRPGLVGGDPEDRERRVRVVTEHKGACCSSPAAICYWCAISLVAWGVLSLIGLYWRPLHASSATTILFAMAIGCVANWLRNRTLHCVITAPLFLLAAVVFLMSDVNLVHVNDRLVWPFVLLGVGIAFLLEWRYAQRSASQL